MALFLKPLQGLNASFTELLHDREFLAQRAREPIQLPNNNGITGVQLIEKLLELKLVPTPIGSLLAKTTFAFSSF